MPCTHNYDYGKYEHKVYTMQWGTLRIHTHSRRPGSENTALWTQLRDIIKQVEADQNCILLLFDAVWCAWKKRTCQDNVMKIVYKNCEWEGVWTY